MSGNPTLTERQKTLLRQIKNNRDLAHLLRTNPRVKGHFDMQWFGHSPHGYLSSRTIVSRPEILHECKTTACAAGWAIYTGIIGRVVELHEAFGLTGIQHSHIFGTTPRTRQAEARILERHARSLEAQL